MDSRYGGYLERAVKKDYPLGRLLIVGLSLMDISGYRYATAYDRRLSTILAQIYGREEAEIHLRLFWASRITYTVILWAVTGFITVFAGPDTGIFVFVSLLTVCVFYLTDRDLKTKLEKRKTSIKLEFPDFVNKLALLINAGMTMEGAWRKIVVESRKPDSPLYRELLKVVRDMEAGRPEIQAYEDFAKRCAIPEITRFSSVIVQNLRKGGEHMVSVLRISANECWQMRKNAARKLGEEASTKMLLPIMLIFLAVLLVVATPAILALKFI